MKELTDVVADYYVTLEKGNLEPLQEEMVAKLLIDDVVFVNSRDYYYKGQKEGHTIVLFVNCNDVFAWGCADSEDVSSGDIPSLFEAHMQDKRYGSDKWCCQQRQQKPQAPLEKMMREYGSWDDTMEQLPANKYDMGRKVGKGWIESVNDAVGN